MAMAEKPVNALKIAVLSFIFFFIGLDTFIISPLIPSIAKSLGILSAYAGLMVTAYSLSYVIISTLQGPLSDTLGRKPLITTGLVSYSLSPIC